MLLAVERLGDEGRSFGLLREAPAAAHPTPGAGRGQPYVGARSRINSHSDSIREANRLNTSRPSAEVVLAALVRETNPTPNCYKSPTTVSRWRSERSNRLSL